MQIFYSGNFGRKLSYLSTILVDRRINLHEINLIESYLVTLGIYRPVYLELRHFRTVGVIIGISPVVSIAYPNPIFINGIVFQTRSTERQAVTFFPKRIIRCLLMERIPIHITFVSLIIRPAHIRIFGLRTIIGYFVITNFRILSVFTASQFVPCIIGLTVAVLIF